MQGTNVKWKECEAYIHLTTVCLAVKLVLYSISIFYFTNIWAEIIRNLSNPMQGQDLTIIASQLNFVKYFTINFTSV